MPLIRTSILLILLVASACAGVAAAQVVPSDSSVAVSRTDADSLHAEGMHRPLPEGRLDEITITASRLGPDVAAAPLRITILGASDVERTGSRNVSELLAARAGLFIRQYGEGLATITLRGASPSQSLVLLDGMRLADPQLGQLDLSLFPTYALSAVEVMHGTGSAVHGADGIGGVVNLRARRASENGARFSSEVGAFGERRAGGGASLRSDASGLVVAAEYAEAQGDFPYVNEALFPAREVRRRNADRRVRSVFASSHHRTGPHDLQLAVLAADAVRGLPGLATADPDGERQWDEHFRVWASDAIRRASGRVVVRGFVQATRLRYANPALDLDDTGRTWSGGLEVERIVPVHPDWLIDGGLTAGFARAAHPMLSREASEMHASVFAEAAGHHGPVTLYPAFRADAFGLGSDRRRLAFSPRIGANLRLLGRRIHLKSALGSAFRSPTFNERYWQPGGNPDVRAERAWSVEAGVHAATPQSGSRTSNSLALAPRPIPSASAELTVLHARTVDQIVWRPAGNGVWVPENLAETGTNGMEASFHATLASRFAAFDAGATYAFTHAVDRSDPLAGTYGRQLRYVPRHVAKGFIGISRNAVRLDVEGRWIGRRFVTSDESESLGPSLVVNARAAVHHVFGGLRAELAVVLENALDADYAVIQHYPMPPRHARVRLLLEID